MSSSSSEIETEIVSLITKIYNLQQALSYYPSDSSIVYPPPSGHHIDEPTCSKLNLSPSVISLMSKIPYPRDFDGVAYSYPFVSDSIAAVYTETACLIAGRDPESHMLGEPLRMDLLKPSELVLTFARRDGVNILLDTADYTIRWWAPMTSPESSWPEGPPQSQPGHFDKEGRDWPDPHDYYPRPAIEVLREMIQMYRTLEWIPRSDDWARIWREARRRLIEDYGCPDNFDPEKFKREKARFWWEADPENRIKA